MTIFNSFEGIAFGHSLVANDYSYYSENKGYNNYGETPENGGVIEIGFVEKNPLVLMVQGQSVCVPENGVFIIPPNEPFSARCENPGEHRHTGVEFLVTCRKTDTPSRAEKNAKRFDFPIVIPPSEYNHEIIAIIQRVVDARVGNPAMSYFEECELFMRLIRKISDRMSIHELGEGISPGNKYLCLRVKKYISMNIKNKMSVAELAESVSVSKNYLTTVFSKTEGVPLTEYINALRVSYLENLVRKYDYSLAEAAPMVGITDMNYASRLFKKFSGMSFLEYKKSIKRVNSKINKPGA